MFDWLFSPSCPCDVAAKEWVEERLQWLSEEFDDHAFNGRRIVLPTPEFFPVIPATFGLSMNRQQDCGPREEANCR